MKLISDPVEFCNVFERLCKEYDELIMLVAWIGNPQNSVPYKYLKHLKSVNAIVGVDFYQTHPDGLNYFLNNSKWKLKVSQQNSGIYHPKMYLFTKDSKATLIIGSSNFTFNGFTKNTEISALIKGETSNEYVIDAMKTFEALDHSDSSFVPDDKWLIMYEERYTKLKAKASPSVFPIIEMDEEKINWLLNASWKSYYEEVENSFLKRPLSNEKYQYLFNSREKLLTSPWTRDYFLDKETRKLITGKSPYGYLGNTSSYGKYIGWYKNGPENEHNIGLSVIKTIENITSPMNFDIIEQELSRLFNLGVGFRMCNWGRMITLVRPDLFTTASSPGLRKELASIINVKPDSLNSVNGYLDLIKQIHKTPWFQSEQPTNPRELYIWKHRVAFLDLIYYSKRN